MRAKPLDLPSAARINVMGARDTLHQLVDELSEDDLATAERVLQALRATGLPHVPLVRAPLVDESDNDFDSVLPEAREDVEAGRVVSHKHATALLAFDYAEENTQRESHEKFLAVLAKVPDAAPDPGDEL